MTQPAIIMPEVGYHNADLGKSQERLLRGRTYQDLSTVIVCPSRGVIPCRVVSSWMNLLRPMNQKIVGPLFATGLEVGEAYNQLVEMALAYFPDYRYLCTIEEDNIPPPDGLMKLYEAIEGGVDGKKYDVVGGLYWTKGEGGQPMIYGDPQVMPKNFVPQLPQSDRIVPANGLGMGFNLFRMSIFRDGKIPKPWFRTVQEYKPGQGTQQYTQDLWFYQEAAKYGYRFACDCRVLVGHLDVNTNTVW